MRRIASALLLAALASATPGCLEVSGFQDISLLDCVPGAHRCEGDTLQRCKTAGRWEDVQICSLGLCDAAGGQCDLCVPNRRSCLDSTSFAVCSGTGQALQSTACPAESPACRGDGLCVCSPGTRECLGGDVPRSCNADGQWELGTPCSGATPMCSQGQCTACETGKRRCVGTVVQECDANHSFVQVEVCSGLTSECSQGACVFCVAGSTRCMASVQYVCIGDVTWAYQKYCPGGCEGGCQ